MVVYYYTHRYIYRYVGWHIYIYICNNNQRKRGHQFENEVAWKEVERLGRDWREESEGESDVIMFYLKMFKNFTQGNPKFTGVKRKPLYKDIFFILCSIL